MTVLSSITFREPRSICLFWGKLSFTDTRVNIFNNVKYILLYSEKGEYLGQFSTTIAFLHNVVRVEYTNLKEVKVYVRI